MNSWYLADVYHMFLNILDTKHKNNQKCDRHTDQPTHEQNPATIILDNTDTIDGTWELGIWLELDNS